ncbi:long-chain fatty acid--CoA ligase [Desulfococcaceae bacterium HSG9]|nr:long-chain fatty acid--CoA ligase [Desulfococcaceae bacterium HSG9]
MYNYEKPDNLVELFEESAAQYADNTLFGTQNADGEYEWVTYRQTGERIDNLRGGLANLGVGKGDVVGIIANNRTEWAITAFATYGLGARFIPMYEKDLRKTWQYIITDGNVKVLLVANDTIYDHVMQFKDQTPSLEHIAVIDGQGDNTMAALEKWGSNHPVASVRPSPGDIAVLIYTSGTTGNPKGVLLSHGNFTSNAISGGRLVPELDANSRSLSILPWAHSFGQTAELYNFIHLGGSIGFIQDITTIADDMGKLSPTYLIAVPRIFNKIYDSLWQKINASGGLAKTLFVMGVEAGKQKRASALQGKSSLLTNLQFKLADAVVFKKIRQKFGGRLQGSITGSATMNVEIGYFFADIGIPVYDCYGLTETSPAVSMNCPAAHKPGSVGRPIQNVKVVIEPVSAETENDEGEIVVYGPNVMQGYNNKPEATREVMTADGGFRTGDLGRLDEDGFLFITGRIKEQYKLENGKYVFPASLEEEIKLLPWIENAMIYGAGRTYNVCLAVPDFEVLKGYAEENNLPTEPAELVERDEIKTLISDAVTDFLKDKFHWYEIPKKFVLMSDPFSTENGLLTQTMKLKRRIVLKRYQSQIDALYNK